MFGNSYESSLKSLQNIADGLAQKGQSREAKIKDKLEAFIQDAQRIKDDITLKTQQLVDAEIDEDTKAQERINKELEQLEAKLNNTENKISAYRIALDSPGLSDGESRKIKAAVLKFRQERLNKVSDVENQIQEAEGQIQVLYDKINRLREEKAVLEQPKEFKIVEPAMKYVHSEFKNPRYETMKGECYYIFEKWLNGQLSQ